MKRMVLSFCVFTVLPFNLWADAKSDEINQLKEKVKQLEEKAEIEKLKKRISDLEDNSNKPAHYLPQANVSRTNSESNGFHPFFGPQIGALGENDELKTGAMYGAQLGMNWNYVGTSINILTYKQDNKVNWLSEGSFSMTPIMFNLYLRLPLENIAAVRLGGGVSYVMVSHTVSDRVVNLIRPFTLQEDVSNGIGYQANGGFDIYITEHVSLGGDIYYLAFKPETTTTVGLGSFSAIVKKDLKLDSVIGLASLKYHF